MSREPLRTRSASTSLLLRPRIPTFPHVGHCLVAFAGAEMPKRPRAADTRSNPDRAIVRTGPAAHVAVHVDNGIVQLRIDPADHTKDRCWRRLLGAWRLRIPFRSEPDTAGIEVGKDNLPKGSRKIVSIFGSAYVKVETS